MEMAVSCTTVAEIEMLRERERERERTRERERRANGHVSAMIRAGGWWRKSSRVVQAECSGLRLSPPDPS